jgi:hypothetical protein
MLLRSSASHADDAQIQIQTRSGTPLRFIFAPLPLPMQAISLGFSILLPAALVWLCR